MRLLPLFLFACLAFVPVACRPPAATPYLGTLVRVQASGEVEVPPDEASITIRLTGLRPNARAAKAYLIEQGNALRDTLIEFGVRPSDIQTLHVDLERSYAWRNNAQVFQGYRASTSMQVLISDLSRLDEIYDQFLDRRELDTYGPAYGHSAIDSLRGVAYLRALDRADVLGESLRGRLSAKRMTVRAISNVAPTSDLQPYDAYAMEAAPRAVAVEQTAAPRFEVSTGQIKVRADLYVDYELR